MKTVFYLYFGRIDDLSFKSSNGVVKKILGQIHGCIELGCTVYFGHLNQGNKTIYKFDKSYNWEIVEQSSVANTVSIFSKFSALLNGHIHYSAFIDFVDRVKIDVLYIRFALPSKRLLMFLQYVKSLENAPKICVEVPSFPIYPNLTRIKKIAYSVSKSAIREFPKYVDRIVTYTSHANVYGVSTIRLSNGVSLNKMREHPRVDKKNNTLVFIGVASLRFWQGYDLFLKAMADYFSNNRNSNRTIQLVLIGEGAAKSNLQDLVAQYSLSKYVQFKGELNAIELDEEYRNADIGVGTLALSRRTSEVRASPLKHREYCMYGLPFLIDSRLEDPDFDNSFRYVYKVFESSSEIDLFDVVQWYDSIASDNLYSDAMFDYASKHLTWESKMRHIFEELYS